ncbi:methyltransferase [Streptomyces olivaceoviridis]|uniref:Methyltransferase n=1 Tax=Streptomyces olivaceoviridis TaxID=1921 RepID=A0ABW7VLA5_STROI|nr:methyltransferase [Streptomyces corchorusii]
MVGKLSKEQTKRHNRACELVDSDSELTETEREFVLDHFHESAHTGRTLDGAFFTPAELAGELHLVIPGNRIIDLCAGIGRLAWHARDLVTRHFEHLPPREIVCVEKNPEYVRVGRRILPEATWICADVLDVPGMNLGPFDCAISNPPFGRIKHSGNTPGYRGPLFEFHVIAVAQTLARRGAFIIPRESAPFRIEGGFVDQDSPAYERFHRETGITLRPNPGIPTDLFRDQWRDASPAVEIVLHNRDEDELEAQAEQAARAQQSANLRAQRPRAAAAATPKAVQDTGVREDADTLF